jgi:hypothetical protein
LVINADFRSVATGATTPRGVILPTNEIHADVASEAVGGVLTHDGFAFASDAGFAIGATSATIALRGVIRQLAFAVNTADFNC